MSDKSCKINRSLDKHTRSVVFNLNWLSVGTYDMNLRRDILNNRAGCSFSYYLFLAFDFCRFCVVIRFFHPRHNGQWPPISKDFYTRSYPLHNFLILILEKESVFPFSMLSAKQGNSWYHFYYVFGLTRSLTGDWTRDLLHSKPALYH